MTDKEINKAINILRWPTEKIVNNLDEYTAAWRTIVEAVKDGYNLYDIVNCNECIYYSSGGSCKFWKYKGLSPTGYCNYGERKK